MISVLCVHCPSEGEPCESCKDLAELIGGSVRSWSIRRAIVQLREQARRYPDEAELLLAETQRYEQRAAQGAYS